MRGLFGDCGGRLALALAAAAACSGCIATSWEHRDSFTRKRETVLVANSTPPAAVFVDGRSVGATPLRLPLFYESIVDRSRRDVTLWQSKPSLAVALTLLTAGVYLPSSLFPVASQSRIEEARFEGNSFRVRLEAEGLPAWESTVELDGQPEQSLDVDLEAASAPFAPFEREP
jgi:hypothetical protein